MNYFRGEFNVPELLLKKLPRLKVKFRLICSVENTIANYRCNSGVVDVQNNNNGVEPNVKEFWELDRRRVFKSIE